MGAAVNAGNSRGLPDVKIWRASAFLAVENVLRCGRIIHRFHGKIHRSIIHGMGFDIRRLPEKVMGIAFRNGHLKGIIEGLPVSQIRYQRFGFAGEVIAARSKVSRAEDHALREFPFHVELILQHVWEFRIVGCREKVEWLVAGQVSS
jgi:hypothetical protein